ncbi:sensor histidine kinase [Roseateles sp.]|uniref:sensor histidine kinase n=1 Tax=Roseateles sp. TaxID=1971397 RepID=UPI003D0F32A8
MNHSPWQTLQQTWRRFWRLQKRRDEPFWARALITIGIGLAFPTGFILIDAALRGRWPTHAWWPSWVLGILIAFTIHAMYRATELLLSQERIDRLQNQPSWRTGLLFAGIPVVGTALGMLIARPLLSWMLQQEVRIEAFESLQGISKFLLISLAVSVIWGLWAQIRWQRKHLQLQATEAQLRLLQAQIEPHFLFNTLANVQSLMEVDAPRARQMLEAFTDYLRASLGQLRGADSTLALELDMAQCYLQLLQIRMGERLSFEIEADSAVRAAVLPPLLLQPLIENAIHHGLEPKVEGGQVRVRVSVHGTRLEIQVFDDGLGLEAPRRPRRAPQAGHGLALVNIRARLQSRYPEQSSLTLSTGPQGLGTVATLSLPFITTASPT